MDSDCRVLCQSARSGALLVGGGLRFLSAVLELAGTTAPGEWWRTLMNDWRGHLYKSVSGMQGTINWRASSNLDFIQNYFLLKHIFNFFDNRNECCKLGFLRGNICTSCTSTL